ncbi:MAG: hypothetical protein WC890_07875 [Candidatus Margulisiibacteriota bacterium]
MPLAISVLEVTLDVVVLEEIVTPLVVVVVVVGVRKSVTGLLTLLQLVNNSNGGKNSKRKMRYFVALAISNYRLIKSKISIYLLIDLLCIEG